MPRSRPTPAERSLQARSAAHRSWAATENPTARTAPGREAFLDRFEREADPTGTLDPQERERRAKHLRKAYFTKLAAKSARSRRLRRERGES
jgi:hypothetical protein